MDLITVTVRATFLKGIACYYCGRTDAKKTVVLGKIPSSSEGVMDYTVECRDESRCAERQIAGDVVLQAELIVAAMED